MCSPGMTGRSRGWTDCACGGRMGGHGHGFRRFFSTQEKLESLENYRDQLKKELTGVEERIREWESK